MWKVKTGDHLESLWSKRLDQSDKINVLISSKLLRSYQCGQVDLAFLKKNHLKIYEVKSGGYISKWQLNRLRGSAQLLSHILNCTCSIEILTGDA